jgi:epoxyqueuosine reductase QueG
MKDVTISANSIESFIKELVFVNPLNKLASIDGGPIFNEPLIGIADGKDILFEDYKRIIGDYYLTPAEAILKMAQIERKEDIVENISVICWTLPFAERIKLSNAVNRTLPASLLWSQGQEQGERFNDFLREQVVKYFRDRGYLAIAPIRSPLYVRYGRYQTNWSERHALYAAGMGTFGLSRWLITERGVAMRCGSVVANMKLKPKPRHYVSHTENCLFYSHGTCEECITRCPAGAITSEGLDKPKCREYLDLYAKVEGCGLCQTGVPCESKIPRRKP